MARRGDAEQGEVNVLPRPWPALLGATALVTVAYVVVPHTPARELVAYGTVLALAVTMAVRGAQRDGPGRRLPATATAVALASFLVAELVQWMLLHLGNGSFPTAADGIFLAGYVPLAVAAMSLSAEGHWRWDRTTWLDSAILTLACGSVVWKVLMDPVVTDDGLTHLAKAVSLAYPLADLVVLGLVIRLVLVRSARTRAGTIFVLGTALTLAADLAFGWLNLRGRYQRGAWPDAGWLLGYLALGASTLVIERRREATTAESSAEPELGQGRLLLVLAAVLVPYALMADDIDQLGGGAALTAAVTVGIGVVLTILMGVRLWGLLTTARRAEARLTAQAERDELTGLATRAVFQDRLGQALERLERHAGAEPSTGVGLLFVDLDNFKLINESLGHGAGDVLLTHVGARLRHAMRPSDTVCQLGGDEFAVLLDKIPGLEQARLLAERILEVLAVPIPVGTHRIDLRASVGAAVATPGCTVESLMGDADVAMQAAKSQGKGKVALFDEGARESAQIRHDLRLAMAEAQSRGELRVAYQPIVDVADRTLRGVEALVRWDHPTRGEIVPDDFIPIAEETGSIVDIGRWVLETACRQAARWNTGTGPPISVAVNVSGVQLNEAALVGDVSRILAASGLEPSLLTLEMTESVLIDHEEIIPVLQALRDLGIGLAIDDFGTGYSSLAYLQEFPITSVKVDRAFVARLTRGGDTGIVAAILALAESSGLTSVAEGVENPDQLGLLHQLNCELAQGFYLGRPQPPEQIDRLRRLQRP